MQLKKNGKKTLLDMSQKRISTLQINMKRYSAYFLITEMKVKFTIIYYKNLSEWLTLKRLQQVLTRTTCFCNMNESVNL